MNGDLMFRSMDHTYSYFLTLRITKCVRLSIILILIIKKDFYLYLNSSSLFPALPSNPISAHIVYKHSLHVIHLLLTKITIFREK